MLIESDVLVARLDGSTAVLTLNRPEARNALNADLLDALREAVGAVQREPSARAVVVTGAGDRAFCAGADIRAMRAMSADDGRKWAQLGHGVLQAIQDLPLPTIAAINGVAAGGGCELALACDFRLVAEGALIGQPEIKLGLIPGWGGTQRLPRLIGAARAKDLVLTGRLVETTEAMRIGLVDRVVAAEALMSAALDYAAQFAALPPLALRFAKHAVDVGSDLDLHEANGVEIESFARCFATEDRVEGLTAFVEKRAARFKGR